MKKHIIIIFLFCFGLSFAQKKDTKTSYFYIRIPNNSDVPKIIYVNKQKKITHRNRQVQRILNENNAGLMEKAFPGAKTEELKNIYLISATNEDLGFKLTHLFKGIFTYSERMPKIEYLLDTNDYGLAWGGEQTNLDLINAKGAWEYTTGNPNIFVGISDLPIRTNHEDLINKVVGYTNTTTSSWHGTAVAGVVSSNTNNSVGLSSIGYNIRLLYKPIDYQVNVGLPNLWSLYQLGAKVLNGSWYQPSLCGSSTGSAIDQLAINEMYDNGTVIVFAAGNSQTCGNSKDNPIYPASYDHVISVTSVGTRVVGFSPYGIDVEWRDRVETEVGNPNSTHHLNYLVDIAAPGFAIPVLYNPSPKYIAGWGTSFAAPHVSGTIGLMFSVNSSITSKEVETILKLTSSNLDTIPENLNYINKMGAGRLDAKKSVEMAYKMAQNQGVIEIKNRDFYRNWDFMLKNAPYGIKINNEIFRDSIKVNFIARNNIELVNTVLEPNSIGFTILSIDSNIPIPIVNSNTNAVAFNKNYKSVKNEFDSAFKESVVLYPNPTSKNVQIKILNKELKIKEVLLLDAQGVLILKKSTNFLNLNVSKLFKGIYFLQIKSTGGDILTKKLIIK